MKCGALAGSLLILANLVGAIRLSLSGRSSRSSLHRRGNISGVGNSTLTNAADISYVTRVTLGGSDYDVLIDTGSSDLWVADTNVPNSKDTGISSSVTYAVGQASGPVMTAPLVFAGYTIPNQAFIQVTPDIQTLQGSGLIGLGPNGGSNVFRDMNQSPAGHTVLDSLFLQNPQTPNILTILLGRSDDPSDKFPGDLTVGETIPGYEDITNQPKLDVTKLPPLDGNQHLQVLLDQDGITGPDGKPIPVASQVEATLNKNQATVVFDSGFTLPQVPKSVSDAIYGGFPGAEYVNIPNLGSVWIVPCSTEANISFTFAGKNFPIHPLDATLEPSIIGLDNLQVSTGEDGCIGTFQPMSFEGSPTYDLILGMAFLRNAYMLANFGDFIDGSSVNKINPYIQLLSITNDTAETHSDFVNVRLNGSDTSGATHSAEAKSSYTSSRYAVKRITTYVIAGCVVGGLLLIGFVAAIASCCRRNRYRPLNYPAPVAPMDVYMVPSAVRYGYNPGARYNNPFEYQRR
jgi:hypothetical protein